MELNQLRYVLEVAKYKNITRAAESLHIAQPSLSHQIINVEREIGINLFERTRKRIYLTEAGENFVYQANIILNSVEQLSKSMQDYAAKSCGSIQIGVLPTMVSLGIPDIINGFIKQYSKLKITIKEHGSATLLKKVSVGELDVAFAILNDESMPDDLCSVKLMESKLVVAVNVNNPLCNYKQLSISQLSEQQFITSSSEFALPYFYMHPLEQQHIKFDIVCVCSQIESSFSLVEKGFGITICSEEISKHYDFENIRYIPLTDVSSRIIYLIYKKNPQYHPALQSFVDYIVQIYSQDSIDI